MSKAEFIAQFIIQNFMKINIRRDGADAAWFALQAWELYEKSFGFNVKEAA
jgi:hypothetical protein